MSILSYGFSILSSPLEKKDRVASHGLHLTVPSNDERRTLKPSLPGQLVSSYNHILTPPKLHHPSRIHLTDTKVTSLTAPYTQ